MNIFRLFFVSVLAQLVVAAASAQAPEESMSLDEAIAYAWTNNTAMRNATIEVEDANQQIIEQRAFGIPQLSGSVDFGHYLVVPQGPIPEAFRLDPDTGMPNPNIPESAAFQLKNNFTAGLLLDAMIFDPTYFTGLKAARAFKELVAQQLVNERRNVKKDVIQAYLPVLMLNQSISILDSNMAIVTTLLEETRQLYEAGFAEQLDVDRQTLALANLKSQRQSLTGDRNTALKRLKYTIGYPVERELEVEGNLSDLLAYANQEELTGNIDFSRRPDYELVQRSLNINEIRVKYNQSGYWPSLRAFGTLQGQYQGNTLADGFWAPSSQIGLSLNVPIFSGLERSARVQRSRLEKQKVEVREADLIRGIRLEVSAARNDYNTAMKNMENQEANLDLAERIFETTKVKYREGVGSSVEVVQAEQGLYDAQRNYLQALYRLVESKLNLDIALGM